MISIKRLLVSSSLSALILYGTCLSTSFAADKHWGYQDSDTTIGPSGWGALPEGQLCSRGTRQTPINLSTALAHVNSAAPELQFQYKPATISLQNNGHSIRVNYQSGSTLKILDKTYTLQQFHFHAKSEHSIDGDFFPLEAHLVHMDDRGDPSVVVAVFFKKGAHNSALDQIFNNFPLRSGEVKDLPDSTFDASVLLPKTRDYFHYQGSLTTPPCTEGIQWFVFKEPVELDADQIKKFTSIADFDHTDRPIQRLGARTVEQNKR